MARFKATAVAPPSERQAPSTGRVVVCDFLIDILVQAGVTHVFGLPGGAVEPLFIALGRYERAGKLKLVNARSESGAAFMADAFFRETGRIGVACATTGPGATNMITAAATAMGDRVPVLFITGQTPLAKFGRGALQDSSDAGVDTVALFRAVTKSSTLVSSVEQLPLKLLAALRRAQTHPRGPVHLAIPSDILAGELEAPGHSRANLAGDEPEFNTRGAQRVFDFIENARRLTVVLGDHAGPAAPAVHGFCAATGASLVASYSAKGWVRHRHPSFRGLLGYGGHESAEQALAQSDAILAIGMEMREMDTAGWNLSLLSDRLVCAHVHPELVQGAHMAREVVIGDLLPFAGALRQRALERRQRYQPNGRPFTAPRTPPDAVSDSPVRPSALFTWLSDHLPERARIFPDAGNSWAWAVHYLELENALGQFRLPPTQGPMGWGVAAAVGTALLTDDPVLLIAGDGCMLHSSQEITVAVQHGRPLLVFVVNDAELGMVRHIQMLGGHEPAGTASVPVDFAGMARAMGATGLAIQSERELVGLDMRALLASRGPVVVDVRIDREEIAPIGARVRALRASGPARGKASA